MTRATIKRPLEAARAEIIRVANVRIAPVTVLDGQVFYGEFSDQRSQLEALLHGLG